VRPVGGYATAVLLFCFADDQRPMAAFHEGAYRLRTSCDHRSMGAQTWWVPQADGRNSWPWNEQKFPRIPLTSRHTPPQRAPKPGAQIRIRLCCIGVYIMAVRLVHEQNG
jgi:hypothetical protein